MFDEKDRAILGELINDSRKTTKAIAKELDIPRATVHDWIAKMEQKKLIRKSASAPNNAFTRSIASCSTMSTYSQPPY